ncbi:MAG: methyltransferase domain-containing protein [Arenicella sp.]|jgi:SAM-dependent methyltransferase|nr:methyltransferase domain-containing protein [Arenicella sp.]
MFKRVLRRLFPAQKLRYNIEQFKQLHGVVFIKGWAYFSESPVANIYYASAKGKWKKIEFEVMASDDVAVAYENEIAKKARFFIRIVDKDLASDVLNMRLKFESGLGSGLQTQECVHLHKHGIERGPYRQFVPNFFADYVVDSDIKTALEIGSRARSGVNNRDTYLPKDIEFTGIDVLDGEGVDVVCDAHQLSEHLESNKYDLVYSLNVFEHLLMPWKVVLELNKVMKKGGIVMIFTHHAYPLHDLPWDYFRFSDNAWYSMFNKETGFEIIKTQLIDPVSIVPYCIYEGTASVSGEPAFIHSAVIARKISDTSLTWPVDSSAIINTEYPG